MKQAIQKAIEGGWKHPLLKNNPKADIKGLLEEGHLTADHYLRDAFLDPLFWQALGKAMGWGKCKRCMGTGYLDYQTPCHECGHSGFTADWKMNWHNFIDHLAEGKDAESFFNELLK